MTRALSVLLAVDKQPSLDARFGGLGVLERQLFLLSRSGALEVFISAAEPAAEKLSRLRIPAGLKLRWDPDSRDFNALQGPRAMVSGAILIRLGVLREALSHSDEGQVEYYDSSLPAGSPAVIRVLPAGTGPNKRRELPSDSTFPLDRLGEARAVLWLLDEARKPTDSFMAKHFDRRISLALTRILLDTPVKPNHMTLFSSALGAAGALLLAGGSHAFVAAGALIIWLHTLLDGCDGELARLKFQESPLGGRLDFWGDNVVHFLLFGCLGLGLARAGAGLVYALLGGVAAASALATAYFVYLHSAERAEAERTSRAASALSASGLEPGAETGPLFRGLEDLSAARSGPARWLASLEHTLSQRDFIYLLVVLTLLDRARPFVWAAGIGTPLFLAVFVFLKYGSGARAPA